jgi:hypothetical protein
MEKVAEHTEVRESELTREAAREYVQRLSDTDLITLAAAVESGIEERRHLDSSTIGGQPSPTEGWDYQREPWAHGHIQKDPKVRKMKDGSVKLYGYWYFQWIEGGNRKSTYIGNDEALASWKAKNPK